MKEMPILMSAPMVQAIIAGRKTMTRRIIKPRSRNAYGFQVETAQFEPDAIGYYHNRYIQEVDENESTTGVTILCPYGRTEKGSILWVRESWNVEQYPVAPEGDCDELLYYYKATEKVYTDMKWSPSIHMPKEAARIWLEVADIRIEKLKDISEEDAIAEGVESFIANPIDHGVRATGKSLYIKYDTERPVGLETARQSFASLWSSINDEESWKVNPWVWVVSFKVLSTTGRPKELKPNKNPPI